MKTIKHNYIKIITVVVLTFAALPLLADAPPPPPPGHGTTGNVPGGGAPIGGGLFILLGLGAAYGGKKIYDYNKKQVRA